MSRSAGFCADQPARAARPARRPSPTGRSSAGRARSVRSRARPSDSRCAALGGDQRMQLVEHDVAQVREEALGIAGGDQQRQLLGRGQQDVGRRRASGAGACGPACRRCGSRCGSAGPSRATGLLEVALDVDGERLQRRDVERVDAAMRPRPGLRFGRVGEIGQRRQEAGQRLAGAGRRDQQHRLARPAPAPAARADAAAAPSRARANHFRNGSGRRAAALSGARRAWLVTPQR